MRHSPRSDSVAWVHVFVAIAAALACAWVTSASRVTAITPMNLYAELNGTYQMPPVVTSMSAVAVLNLDAATGRLHYWIVWDLESSTVTGLHLHFWDGSPKIYMSLTGVGMTDVLTQIQRSKILNKGSYLNIHTVNNPNGEVLGTVYVPQPGQLIYSSVALPEEETVFPSPAPAGAMAVGILRLDLNTNIMSVNSLYNNAAGTIDLVHVHNNTLGLDMSAPCVLSGTSGAGSCPGMVQAVAAASGYYTNYHHPAPAGLFRGQVIPMTPYVAPATSHWSADVVMPGPSSRGIFLMSYEPSTMMFTWSLFHNDTSAMTSSITAFGISMVLCQGTTACGRPYQTGSMVGYTAKLFDGLQNGWGALRVYYNSDSTFVSSIISLGGATTNGATPGPMMRKYAAIIDPYQELPAVPGSAGIGAALLWLSSTNMLTYSAIWTGLSSSLSGVHLHHAVGAVVGVNTTVRFAFPTAPSATGVYGTLDATSFPDIVSSNGLDGQAYWNLHTADHPVGEIRGYFKALSPLSPPAITHYATLTASPGVTTTQSGYALFVLDPVEATLSGAAFYTGLDGGDSAPAGIVLDSASSGTASLQFLNAFLLQVSLPAPITSVNTLSVAIRTAMRPNGAGFLSGALTTNVPSTFVGFGFAAFEVPTTLSAPNVNSTGFGAAIITFTTVAAPGVGFSPLFQTYNYFLSSALTQIHFHYAAFPGANSVPKFFACGGTAPACPGPPASQLNYNGANTTTVAAANARMGASYTNWHTSVNTGGEVRAEMTSVAAATPLLSASPAYTWGIKLMGAGTTAVGAGVFKYDTASRTLSFVIHHTVTSPTAAHIHVGASNVSGPVAYPFPSAASPMIGSFVFAAPVNASEGDADVCNLYSGLLYVNIHSTAFPSGEIRAQIAADPNAVTFSMLSGSQCVPTSSSMSSGVVIRSAAGASLIVHSVGVATAAGESTYYYNPGVSIGSATQYLAAAPQSPVSFTHVAAGASVFVNSGTNPSCDIAANLLSTFVVQTVPAGACPLAVTPPGSTTGAAGKVSKKSITDFLSKPIGIAIVAVVIVLVIGIGAAIVFVAKGKGSQSVAGSKKATRPPGTEGAELAAV